LGSEDKAKRGKPEKIVLRRAPGAKNPDRILHRSLRKAKKIKILHHGFNEGVHTGGESNPSGGDSEIVWTNGLSLGGHTGCGKRHLWGWEISRG
jgi:hypothetical protein